MRSLRCICGHTLDQHLGIEECKEPNCLCLDFEIDWDAGEEERLPA